MQMHFAHFHARMKKNAENKEIDAFLNSSCTLHPVHLGNSAAMSLPDDVDNSKFQ